MRGLTVERRFRCCDHLRVGGSVWSACPCESRCAVVVAAHSCGREGAVVVQTEWSCRFRWRAVGRAVACRRRRRHHPALRAPLLEGGECAGFVSVCGKTVHPSPATLASSLVSTWRGRGDVSTSPATTPDPSAAPPASRPARKSPRLQADPTQAPLRPQIAPPASRPNQRSESPRTVGEQRHLTTANSTGPATFPSSQEGWPKAGVVGPRRPSGRCRHLPHLLIRFAQKGCR